MTGWIQIVTWLVRLLTGGLFIVSGFVKAIDPWGTIFKIEEYMAAIGFMPWSTVIRVMAFGLCALEFVIGCFLLLGCFRKSCPVFAAMIMCVMLPLSVWIVISNPVTDCGCFGDAFKVSDWVTLAKNVLLCAGIGWLIIYNTKAICLITPPFQWLAVVASEVFIFIVMLLGYFYQPLIDFRDYPIGSPLFSSEMMDDDEEADYVFTYQKDGEQKDFSMDNLPDEAEGWLFVSRRHSAHQDIQTDKEKRLQIFDVDSGDEITEDRELTNGRELVVMIPEVGKVSPATTWKLNSLYEWSQKNDVNMIGIVAGNLNEIDRWEDLSMASYPVYVADDTSIKEVVRGNPGIVYMENDTIIWKSTLNFIDVDDFLSPEVTHDAREFGQDGAAILRSCAIVYLIVIAFLILISFTPRLASLMMKGGLASKRGVRNH